MFSFPTPIKHIINLDTRPNPMGLCEVSPLETSEKQILVYPGNKIGSIHIMVIIANIIPYKICTENNYKLLF